jgi:biopolymer transport protein ExbD
MSATRSPLGSGLYFLDVLACLLFAIVLALVGARFGSEQTVELELPELAASDGPGAALSEREIAIRESGNGLELWLDGEKLSLAELRTRLAAAPPPSIVVRSEASALSEVVGAAHEAGVAQIELAYETKRGGR